MSEPRDDLVEEYLDLLYVTLRTTPRDARRVLAEAEDHLREAVADGLAAGLTPRQAQEQAISSFGSVSAVARAHTARLRRYPVLTLLRDLAMSAWLLGSVGLIAVGGSGLIAALMNWVAGPRFVGGTPSAAGLSAATCRYYLSIWPAAHNCSQAAMLEISSDAVSLRVAAGAAGLVLLAGYLITRTHVPRAVLPGGFLPTVAVSLFGAAGVGLAWLSVKNGAVATIGGAGLSLSGGAGLSLSGAIVALVMALAFAWRLRRTLLLDAPR